MSSETVFMQWPNICCTGPKQAFQNIYFLSMLRGSKYLWSTSQCPKIEIPILTPLSPNHILHLAKTIVKCWISEKTQMRLSTAVTKRHHFFHLFSWDVLSGSSHIVPFIRYFRCKQGLIASRNAAFMLFRSLKSGSTRNVSSRKTLMNGMQ